MLLTVFLMAFHVSLAVHYCGGHTASVRMYGKATGMCCCGNEMNEQDGRTYDTPGYLPDGDVSCCSDKVWTVATDDYQAPSAVTVFKPSIVMTPFVFVQTQALQLDGIYYRIIFPPGAVPVSGKNLLTQICILRI
jgi:hypothetical protein